MTELGFGDRDRRSSDIAGLVAATEEIINTEPCLRKGAKPSDASKYERRGLRFVSMENVVPIVEELMKASRISWALWKFG